mmetsp:Transcript_36923/g.61187  ORF Transcript_36923/g.61187 Transcript_36923/m.61187 type:complete len:304 (-) Transcript_36923:210-1121(-)
MSSWGRFVEPLLAIFSAGCLQIPKLEQFGISHILERRSWNVSDSSSWCEFSELHMCQYNAAGDKMRIAEPRNTRSCVFDEYAQDILNDIRLSSAEKAALANGTRVFSAGCATMHWTGGEAGSGKMDTGGELCQIGSMVELLATKGLVRIPAQLMLRIPSVVQECQVLSATIAANATYEDVLDLYSRIDSMLDRTLLYKCLAYGAVKRLHARVADALYEWVLERGVPEALGDCDILSPTNASIFSRIALTFDAMYSVIQFVGGLVLFQEQFSLGRRVATCTHHLWHRTSEAAMQSLLRMHARYS